MPQTIGDAKAAQQRRSLKNFWINPAYQSKYVFWVTFTGLLLLVLNSAVFYTFTSENYQILVELSPMTDEAKQQLYKELWQIIGWLIVGGVGFLMLVGIVGIVYSHRTAGPFYKFKKVFKQIQDGDHTARVHLRPNDDFRDVAAAFNEMMDELSKRIK